MARRTGFRTALVVLGGMGLVAGIATATWWAFSGEDEGEVELNNRTKAGPPALRPRPLDPQDALPPEEARGPETPEPSVTTWNARGAILERAGLARLVVCPLPEDAPAVHTPFAYTGLSTQRRGNDLHVPLDPRLTGAPLLADDGTPYGRLHVNRSGACTVTQHPAIEVLSGRITSVDGLVPEEAVVCNQVVDVAPDGSFELESPIPGEYSVEGGEARMGCSVLAGDHWSEPVPLDPTQPTIEVELVPRDEVFEGPGTYEHDEEGEMSGDPVDRVEAAQRLRHEAAIAADAELANWIDAQADLVESDQDMWP